MRADAARNRQAVLVAARDVFVELGPDAPLEEIARRAGVGIGTLYRRFPTRDDLMRAVILDALSRTRTAAEAALDDPSNEHGALATYMHAALELRISAVIPALLDRVNLEEPTIRAARDASSEALARVVATAHADGVLPTNLTFADVGMLLVRLAHPLPGPMSIELDLQVAHRHLDLVLEGMRSMALRGQAVSGPEISREELQRIGHPAEPQVSA
jgi:AcrR family transcriptional regulator